MKMFVACAIAIAAASAAFAQTRTVTGETKTITATVESIESATREVSVKKPDGTYDVWYIPPNVQKFDTLKIGDKVTARYYENLVLTLKKPGEPAKDEGNAAVTRAGRGATLGKQRTITATIAAIDMNAPSVTFTGPNNWKYSTRVEDKAALSKVKVGDKVDITWTEATIISLGGEK
jgi:hypothetical protein